MKRFICRNLLFVILFIFLFFCDYKPLNEYKPWFALDYEILIIIAFIIFLINSFCHLIIKNKYLYYMYLSLIIEISLLFISNTIIVIGLMSILVILNAYLVNKLYQHKSIAGYLYLFQLCFCCYLFVSYIAKLFVL